MGVIIHECDLSQLPMCLQNLQYVCMQDAVNQLLLYAPQVKKQLHSLHICVKLVGCGKEITNVAGFLI